jgi:hypothetical protein
MEALGDLHVAQALRHQREDLQFASCEQRRVSPRGRPRTAEFGESDHPVRLNPTTRIG